MLCKIVLQKLIFVYENSSYTKLVIDCAKLISVYEYVLYSRRARIQLRKTLGPLQLQRSPRDQLGSLQQPSVHSGSLPLLLWTVPGTGVVSVNAPTSASNTHLHPQDTGNPHIRPPLALEGAFPVAIQEDGGLTAVALYLQHVACKISQKGEKEQRRFWFLTTLVLRRNTCFHVHLTDDGPLGTGQAGGDGHSRGWGGWMVSSARWTWVWVNSGSWWWTGRPGVLQSTGSQRVGHSWTELNWTELNWARTWEALGSPFPDPPHHPLSQTLVPATLLERQVAVTFFLFFFFVCLFICLPLVLVAACGIFPYFSLIVTHRLQKTQPQELPIGHSCLGACGIFPDQGSNPVLEGGFLTTRPPGKSLLSFFP